MTIYDAALQLLQQKKLDDAKRIYEGIIQDSALDVVLNDLGVLNFLKENYSLANNFYEVVLSFDSKNAKTHLNYANSLRALKELDAAEIHYRAAFDGDNDIEWRLRTLEQLIGLALERGRKEDAHEYWKKVLEIAPNNLQSIHNYGNFLQEVLSDFSGACETYKKLDDSGGYPLLAQLYNDWAIALKNQAQKPQAHALYEKSIALNPQPHIFSNMLYDLLFFSDKSEQQLLDKHREYEEKFTQFISKRYEHTPDKTAANSKMKIGYVSPDFRYHSVGMFIYDVLKNHNRDEVEVYCYYTCPVTEDRTLCFKEVADVWRDVAAASSTQLAEQINADKIDILIDLCGHTRGNSMMTFLAKPAPLQISWIGYTFSTGLQAIDYFISDEIATPKGSELNFSERVLKLPASFLCYSPHDNLPAVAHTPALTNGYITFGLFGNIAKLNADTAKLYADVMLAIPHSRLVIQSSAAHDEAASAAVLDMFARQGITEDRLWLRLKTDIPEEYLASFNEIDVLLDWHPFNGETITCNALSMGVPVISLYGDSHRSRAGLSILTAIGRSDWAAGNHAEFVAIALRLVSSIDKLNDIRQSLRAEFLQSPVCDAHGFSRDLERAYRKCWTDWCLGCKV